MTSSKAVNVPVNEKQKEKDVNNKLQLYGIVQGASRVHLHPPVPDASLTQDPQHLPMERCLPTSRST